MKANSMFFSIKRIKINFVTKKLLLLFKFKIIKFFGRLCAYNIQLRVCFWSSVQLSVPALEDDHLILFMCAGF